QVLAGFFRAGELDQHADLATVDIAGQLVGGLETIEAADGNVLADLADQGCAGAFDRAIAHGQFVQCGDIGRVLFSNQLDHLIDEADEVVVLGDKVGFAVDFDDCAALAVGRHIQADEAFSRDTGCSLACFVAQFYTENLFSTGQVAFGLGQCLLALHHRRVGFLAQFFNHGCGNLCHSFLQFFKTRPGGPGQVRNDISGRHRRAAAALDPGSTGAYVYSRPSSSTSTNSSSPSAISSTRPFRFCSRPSRTASAMPLAYSAMALAESSLPGMM